MTRRPIILLFHKSGLALLLFGLLLLSGGGWYALSALSSPNLQNKVIVLDPGHGGQDPGAQFGGIQEKNINLAIAIRLRDVLAAKGCKVILTREVDKDFFLPNFVLGRMAKRAELSQRIKMASINQADIFISLHANSFPGGNSYGMETYYQVKSLAGKELGDLIQTELKKIQPDNKRKAKSGDYYLLNQTQMPAVIVEVGFLSNPKERKLLQDQTYQDRIAVSIASGIESYFHKYPNGIQETLPANEKTVLGPAPLNSSSFKLYYPALNSDELKAEERMGGPAWAKLSTEDKLQIILIEFLKGPKDSQTFFPIQSPQLLNYKLVHGILTLNFSDSLHRGFSGGAAEEEKAIKALVWSTAQAGNISGVKIQINGQSDESIGGHISLDQTFSPKASKGKIALVIEGFGMNSPGTSEMLQLNVPLTAAVMPNQRFSNQEAELIHQKGYDMIIQLPMNTNNKQNVAQTLDSFPYAIGLIDSIRPKQAAENFSFVKSAVEAAKARQYFVLDSNSSESSPLFKEAQAVGLPTGHCDIVLDNTNDTASIKKQLHSLIDLAKKKGKAIGTAHIGPQSPSTAQAIHEMLPEFQNEGIQIVSLDELLN